MTECALLSRPIRSCQSCLVLLACLVFVAVAATAVYLSGLTSTPHSEAARQDNKHSIVISLPELHLNSAMLEETSVVPATKPENNSVTNLMATTSKLLSVNETSTTDSGSDRSISVPLPSLASPGSYIYSRPMPSYCQIPHGGFKAWKSGLVTVLEPVIPRDCRKLMAGDEAETRRIRAASKVWKNALTDTKFLLQTKDCLRLRNTFSNSLYNTVEERNFPLAFTFVVNDSPQQVFRLLKLLYRPQNTFCIHYDVKTSPTVHQMFDNLARCFNNVMIASKLEDVVWGYNTIMEAQMNCLHDLHRYRSTQPAALKWRYVINLCGKELPLVTNQELVLHLKALKGSSSVVTHKASEEEVRKRIRYKAVLNKRRTRAVTSSIPLGSPPFDIKIYKGSSYNAFSYVFADFLLTDTKAQIIHRFFLDCKNPEEHFYASVFMMHGVPGGYNRQLSEHKSYVRVARAIWCSEDRKCSFGFYCHGQVLHDVCITDSADLPAIMKSSADGHMFHNKYFSEMDHTVMDCMEERIVAENKEDYGQDCNLERG